MGTFRLVIDTPLPPAEAWARVLDLRVHDAVVPLTRITEGRVAAADLRVGSRFIARTAVGPLGVNDSMVVDALQAPEAGRDGIATIRKEGTTLHGAVTLQVTGRPDGGSTITWDQELRVRWVSAVLQPVVVRVAKMAYGRSLRRILTHCSGGPDTV